MRGASLRVKINIAIFVAFVAAALAFGTILSTYMGNRRAAAQNRTRALLGVLAAHRIEALGPLLDAPNTTARAKDILERLIRVDGVTEAALFDADGQLLAAAGSKTPVPLLGSAPLEQAPRQRVFTVAAAADGKLAAALVEPILRDGRPAGYLRLRYTFAELRALNQRVWVVFALAVAGAYAFLTILLNLMLHRLVLRPVDGLRHGLEAVQSGQFGLTVPVTSRDALGRVAMAFNAMSARLKETDERLALSRVELEDSRRLLARRVEERTAELARANERLSDEVAARRGAEVRQARALALHKAILASKTEGALCLGLDEDYTLLAWNERFLELWGLSDDWPDQPRGERRRLMREKLADPGGAEVVYEGLMADIQRQEAGVLALADGRFLGYRSGPITEGGDSIGRAFSFVDITEEKKNQERTERDKCRAEQASRAKGAFLAVMSHEIRTPLNVVIGLTEELLAGPASAGQREHLNTIQGAAGHLLDVVNDVLDFSKIEAGKLVLERADFDIRQLVESVGMVFGHQARQKGLHFEASVDEAVPRLLRGDAGRLRQVLVNLVGNAVKFTPSGSVGLRLTPAPTPADGPDDGRVGLAIRVTDTGIGMDETQQATIFQDFEQGPGNVARRFGGTGLGLAIVKGLVTRMGGHVAVASAPGEGSTFTCTLRLEPASGGEAAVPAGPATGPTPGAALARQRRLRILLVEDNALNAAVTQLHMNRMGHELAVAASARDAYARLAREHFDVVLMDIEMPEIDGITATRTIRAGGKSGQAVLDPQVPIIAVTAHALEDVRQECLEAGMTGFISKPVNFKTLRQVLEESEPSAAAPAVPAAAVFDPEAACTAMGLSGDQFRSLCLVSYEEADRRLSEAIEALEAGNPGKAGIDVHTFKGAAATLGAYSCRDAAKVLEKALREGDTPAARAAAQDLKILWGHVGRAFADWRSRQGL